MIPAIALQIIRVSNGYVVQYGPQAAPHAICFADLAGAMLCAEGFFRGVEAHQSTIDPSVPDRDGKKIARQFGEATSIGGEDWKDS